MSSVLRVSGVSFDVDSFLAASRLKPCKVWHVGEQIRPSRPPSDTAGFNVGVGDAGTRDITSSIGDAIRFLGENRAELSRLATLADMTLDFGVANREIPAQYCRFPSELIRLAAEFRMEIEVSIYMCEP